MKKYFLRLLRKIGLLKKLNLIVTKRINGIKFKIPIQAEVGFSNYLDLSEQWMIDLAKITCSKVDPNKTFVDIGLNTGQTLLKIKSIAPNINYLGFEPNPDCMHYLSKLVECNNFTNTRLYPVGISDHTEVLNLKFYQDDATDSSASLINDFRENSSIIKQVSVPVFKINQIKDFNKIDIGIIKIDVEGGELEVMREFELIISEQKPVIFLEILPIYEASNELRIQRQSEILEILNRLDYKIYRVIKNGHEFKTLDLISSIEMHGDLNQCDYVLVHSSREKEFSDSF